MRLLLVAAAGLSTIGAALAVQTPAQAPTAGDQLICKTHVPTGTRFARRTCRTKAEHDQITAEQRRAASEMIDTGRPNICSGDDCKQVQPVCMPGAPC